jgi:16S rRNA (cytosine1402-N4)-methyltransferase
MMYHDPVLLQQSIEGLNVKPEGIYVDATFGGGGHSKEILKYLTTGKLVAFDRDEDALRNMPDNKNLIFVRHNYRYMRNFLKYHNIHKVDGILADLGVSSHQFDEADRGFSFRADAALDMRMSRASEKNAQTILNTYTDVQLKALFVEYGELPNAWKLASTIVQARKDKVISTTGQFVEIIKNCIPRQIENKVLAQVFQAIRIEVNGELESLKEFLSQSTDCLVENGRLSVITYHSLEDRLVKNFMKAGNFEGKLEKDFYGNIIAPFRAINKNVIVPDEAEINRNNRARSAKLRVAEKIGKLHG